MYLKRINEDVFCIRSSNIFVATLWWPKCWAGGEWWHYCRGEWEARLPQTSLVTSQPPHLLLCCSASQFMIFELEWGAPATQMIIIWICQSSVNIATQTVIMSGLTIDTMGSGECHSYHRWAGVVITARMTTIESSYPDPSQVPAHCPSHIVPFFPPSGNPDSNW